VVEEHSQEWLCHENQDAGLKTGATGKPKTQVQKTNLGHPPCATKLKMPGATRPELKLRVYTFNGVARARNAGQPGATKNQGRRLERAVHQAGTASSPSRTSWMVSGGMAPWRPMHQ
jgi:hypothetical protein